MSFLDNSKHLARVWRANARTAIIREMEFRVNFYSGLARQLLWAGAFILFIHIIFQNTQSLAGWSKVQVLTLLALSRIIEGLSDTFFNRNISNFPATVQNGTFDFFLNKPIPAQFHTTFHRFKFLDLGNTVIGLALLSYAIWLEPTLFTLTNWLLFFLLTTLGLILYYCFLLVLASLVFWLDRLDSFIAISQLSSEPLTVPFDVFPAGIKTTLTYILPLAFIVFVPAQALTGRLELYQIPLAIGMTIIFLIIANLVWRAGLRRYSSASS